MRGPSNNMNWEELVEVLNTMPKTWIPAILLVVVELAIKKQCFVSGGLQQAIEEKIKWMKKNGNVAE